MPLSSISKAGSEESGDAVPTAPLAIVGIGASGASFSALERLFAHLPHDAGLAYVVVVKSEDRLDPVRVLATLSSHSGLRGVIAPDRVEAEPDTIYMAPLDAKLSFKDGRLQITQAVDALGERGSIDTLLVSLAEENGERAIGVVLQGVGSDGVLGTANLKEAGGLAIVEMDAQGGEDDEALTYTAEGLADFILPVEKIPERLTSYATHLASLAAGSPVGRAKAALQLPKIAAILRNRTGHDFHGYKRNTFLRRVQRRMHVVQIGSIEQYVAHLQTEPGEVGYLFQDLLISVTQFFRDPQEFTVLENDVIPKMFEGNSPADRVRVWVMGCATGEEAYSLAIILREHMATLEAPPAVQIFATDIDNRALALARTGRFSAAIAHHVTPERLARWFVREGDTYRIHKELREMCLFSAHNIIRDAPFSRIDLISCRNLLIYLNTELQSRVIPLFHFGLRPGGHLFLGPSENVTRHAKLFEPIDRKHRIFRRLETTTRVMPEFPLGLPSERSRPAAPGGVRRATGASGSLIRHAERVAERYAPAYVIINGEYDVLHFSGGTGRYLDPSSGAANLNLLSLVHRDLRLDLRAALHRAAAQSEAVSIERLRLPCEGGARLVTVIVETAALTPPEAVGFVVVFQDQGVAADGDDQGAMATTAQRDEHVQRLEADLRLTRERLQATIEELESTNEELKSSNEEYQSINEELQSANEELETSKEELQSVNEELQTVNSELAHRVNDLAKSNSDLKNLLESTQIATIFLDNDLRVRSFTPMASELFHLLETDIGRPIGHIAARVAYPELQDDVRKVLRTLSAVERDISNPQTDSNYLVRVLPYRSIENFIAGAVLTFLDVTAAVRAERALGRSEARYKLILDSSIDYAIIAMDRQRAITAWNSGAENIFGWTAAEALGRSADMIFTPEDLAAQRPNVEVAEAQASGRAADERWHIRRDGSRFWAQGMMTPLAEGPVTGYLKILHDRTGERIATERQKLLLAELQHRVRNILAVVRSLASRTLENSQSLADFSENFDGRLATLARTQNVLTRTSDVAIELGELVSDELLSVGVREGEQAVVDGPLVRLRQGAAETFALAVHELTTNALKYGALSRPEGTLEVTWRVLNTPEGAKLTLEWREQGVPLMNIAPSRIGFGRELIEQALPYELGASTSLDFRPGGLHASIEMPLNAKTALLNPTELEG